MMNTKSISSRRKFLATSGGTISGVAALGFIGEAEAKQKKQDHNLTLNVLDFGAIGDGQHDDTEAFQAAIDASGGGVRVIIIPPGQWLLTESLNCTNGGLGLTFRGFGTQTQLKVKFSADHNNQPLFDCTGSSWTVFEKMWIEGDQDETPGAAILFSRNQTNASAGLHRLRDLQIVGWWNIACVLSISSESNVYINCEFQNLQKGGMTASVTAQNDLNISSKFAIFPNVFSGGNTVHKFIGCIFLNPAEINDTTACVLYLATIRDIAFLGCFFAMNKGGGKAGLYITGGIDSLTISGCSGELQSGQYGILIESDVKLTNSTINAFSAGRFIRCEDGSEISNSQIDGFFAGTTPGAIDAFIFNHNLVNSKGLGITVRGQAIGNNFWGMTSGTTAAQPPWLTLPDDRAGNMWGERVRGTDGTTRYLWHIGNDGGTSRTVNHYTRSNVYKTNVQKIDTVNSLPVPNTISPNVFLGAMFEILLDGDLLVNNANAGPDNIWHSNPSEPKNSFDEGTELTFVFQQDSIGGRNINFDNNYLVNWVPDLGPHKINTIRFVLNSQTGKWIQVASIVSL